MSEPGNAPAVCFFPEGHNSAVEEGDYVNDKEQQAQCAAALCRSKFMSTEIVGGLEMQCLVWWFSCSQSAFSGNVT